jgi:hypothetical protein
VTDIEHYIYCPRLVYFDHVLHAQPVFGSQQEEGTEQHEDYVQSILTTSAEERPRALPLLIFVFISSKGKSVFDAFLR